MVRKFALNAGNRKEENVSSVLRLELAGCMIYFKHRLPTTEEINSLKQYCLKQGDPHEVRHHFLIKLRTNFINRSLIMNKRTV
jgi:hypothetical protein